MNKLDHEDGGALTLDIGRRTQRDRLGRVEAQSVWKLVSQGSIDKNRVNASLHHALMQSHISARVEFPTIIARIFCT